MTQPIHLIAEYYVVEVPEGAENIRISQLIGMPKLFADFPGYLYAVRLQPGNWQIICTTKEVKAMHAPELFGHAMISDYYAQETVNALLTSKSLNPESNYLIIKKVS